LGLFRLSWGLGWRSFRSGYCCWVGLPWSSCFGVSILDLGYSMVLKEILGLGFQEDEKREMKVG
jgi:hypothetical protein